MDLQEVVDESRPMLEKFLCDIGLHKMGSPLELDKLLDPFSAWVDSQEVTDENRFYLASRLGAFICEYLIGYCLGQRIIENERIIMRMPVKDGAFQDVDPYSVAIEMAKERNSLKEYINSF